MRGIANFEIIGRVGKIKSFGTVLKVSIASDNPKRDTDGHWQSNTSWNTVTIFGDRLVEWIEANVQPGDLVRADGTLRQSSYEKHGQETYTVDLLCQTFNRLATREQLGSNSEPAAA